MARKSSKILSSKPKLGDDVSQLGPWAPKLERKLKAIEDGTRAASRAGRRMERATNDSTSLRREKVVRKVALSVRFAEGGNDRHHIYVDGTKVEVSAALAIAVRALIGIDVEEDGLPLWRSMKMLQDRIAMLQKERNDAKARRANLAGEKPTKVKWKKYPSANNVRTRLYRLRERFRRAGLNLDEYIHTRPGEFGEPLYRFAVKKAH